MSSRLPHLNPRAADSTTRGPRPLRTEEGLLGALASALRRAVGLLLLASLLAGCGSAAYSFRINAAISRFEEAKTIGAEETAPYEYYSAEVRIKEARRLAARAEYGSAIKLAREAEGFSGKAIVASREAKARADAKGTPTPYVETQKDPTAREGVSKDVVP